MKIFRILGFKDFLRYNEVTSQLKEQYPQDSFENCQHVLFAKNPELRLWMIGTDMTVYFVLDNGTSLDVVHKRDKGQLDFSITEGEDVAKLHFPNTDLNLPIDVSITGGTQTIIDSLNKYKK